MKILDEYAGRVIVFFISIFKRKKTQGRSDEIKNILFIKFWGIGSIILSAPAVSKVRAAYPGSKIYFLTLESNREVCSELISVYEIVTIDISNPFKFISDFFKAMSYLRKVRFNTVYDFEFYTYFSAIIVSLLKGRRSFGFDNLKNNRKIIFTDTILFNNKVHTKDNFVNLVSADERVKELKLPDKKLSDTISFTGKKNGEFIITVNPNAGKLAFERRLPQEKFIEIIDHITKKFQCKVKLIGSKEEVNYVEDIYLNLENKSLVYNLCGKTSVRELFDAINSSACLITNDSGPLHIASALNIPVIAFFGPESPRRYGPLSEKEFSFL